MLSHLCGFVFMPDVVFLCRMSSTDAISLRSFHESNNATPVLSSRGKSRRSSGLLSSQKEVSGTEYVGGSRQEMRAENVG